MYFQRTDVHLYSRHDTPLEYVKGEGYEGLQIGPEGTNVFIFTDEKSRLSLIHALMTEDERKAFTSLSE